MTAIMKKGFSMNRVLSTIKKRPTFAAGSSSTETPASAPALAPDPSGETPEATAVRCVKQFCESGGSNSGDDITFLPYIVDAAESSPAAAAECARYIRKFLHRDYWTKPSFQYNAIMLVRILCDNPGPTFTRNLDKKFVDVTKELLRSGRDPNVRQMLMETLDSFENTKAYDEGLALIIEMWKKEKEKAYKVYGGRPDPTPRVLQAPPFDSRSQEYFSRSHQNRRLPNPVELANRLEEARTSAKLLEQVVACTGPDEILQNDLIKEFSDRCLSASRSIQGYMTAEPTPDNDTMESLIDTNEQLQQALNHHQRAMLQAKKHLGLGARSENASPLDAPGPGAGGFGPPPPQTLDPGRPSWPVDSSSSRPDQAPALPSRKPVGNGKGKATDTRWESVGGPSRSNTGTPRHDTDDDGDPFRDPVQEPSGGSSRRRESDDLPRLPYESFHPGFNPATHGKGKDDGKPDPVTPVSDDGRYDDDDPYRATPPKKDAHVYRY